MKRPLFLLISCFMLSCTADQKPVKAPLPNTPAEVAQVWIEAFYNDNFVKALELSTDITRMMIDSVKKEMEPNVAPIAFTISNMSCQTQQDSAVCTYIYQEDLERYEEYLNLLRVKGQWLVHESWESAADAAQELDMIREELEKILEEEQE